MRFCLVTTFYPPQHFGGDGLFVYHLANALAERDHEVEVVHCADAYRTLAGPRDAAKASFPNHPKVLVHTLRSALGALSPLWTQQVGGPGPKSRALREILASSFDVIHFHNISLIGGPRVLSYGDAVKLYTLHEFWLVCPTHTMFRMNREPCREAVGCARCMIAHHRPPQAWRFTQLVARCAKHVDTFLSPSRYGIDVHRRFGFDGPMQHLPNFVRTSDDPVRSLARERRTFLYAGRLERLKGVGPLMDFFRDWEGGRLRIAGTGSEREALEARAAGCERIEFLGQLDGPAMREAFRQATALIVPSLASEQMPLVILEALAQETPVIGNDTGAVREVIEESEGGVVYRDIAELERHLTNFVENPERAIALGVRGEQVARGRWSEDLHLERYFTLIDELEKTRSVSR